MLAPPAQNRLLNGSYMRLFATCVSIAICATRLRPRFFGDRVVLALSGFSCLYLRIVAGATATTHQNMQPCSADRLLNPAPDYISYTARLLLASSTLLAQVGSRAGMDQSRSAQSHDPGIPDWHEALDDPPTSRWANVRIADPSVAPSHPHERKKKRIPADLESLSQRRQESLHPRSLSPYTPAQASPRSAPAAQPSYPASISGPLAMPAAVRPEQRPSPLRVPTHNSSRNYTTQPPARAVSSEYPMTPQYFYPVSPLERPRSSSHTTETLRSPLRIAQTYPGAPWESSPIRTAQQQRRPSATFDDDAELHQFAEATSGFDPFSPVRQRPLSQVLYREYYAPRAQSASTPPASYSQPIAQHPFQPTPPYNMDRNPVITRTSSATIAQALREMEEAEGDYDMPPDDEELPDYAQSQWEAQSHARRAAARRAAELERQWMESRQRRGSR